MRLLCTLDELEKHASRGFSVDGTGVVVVRADQEVFAYRNRCPHLGIPLEWVADQFLDYDGDFIQCSTHGALFTIEQGLCVQGPCAGQSLEKIDLELRDSQVWIAWPCAS